MAIDNGSNNSVEGMFLTSTEVYRFSVPTAGPNELSLVVTAAGGFAGGEPVNYLEFVRGGFAQGVGVIAVQTVTGSNILFSVGQFGAMSAPGCSVECEVLYRELALQLELLQHPYDAANLLSLQRPGGTPSSHATAQGRAFEDVFNNAPVCKAYAYAGGVETNNALTYDSEERTRARAITWYRPIGTAPLTNIDVDVAISLGGFLDVGGYAKLCDPGCGPADWGGVAACSVQARVHRGAIRNELFNGSVSLTQNGLSVSNDWPDPLVYPGNFQLAPSDFAILLGSTPIWGGDSLTDLTNRAYRVAVNRVFTNAISVGFHELIGPELIIEATAYSD